MATGMARASGRIGAAPVVERFGAAAFKDGGTGAAYRVVQRKNSFRLDYERATTGVAGARDLTWLGRRRPKLRVRTRRISVPGTRLVLLLYRPLGAVAGIRREAGHRPRAAHRTGLPALPREPRAAHRRDAESLQGSAVSGIGRELRAVSWTRSRACRGDEERQQVRSAPDREPGKARAGAQGRYLSAVPSHRSRSYCPHRGRPDVIPPRRSAVGPSRDLRVGRWDG